jgi:hypothetical protein
LRAAAQAWQVPSQAVSQQTPSTQKPLWHSAPRAQAWPWGWSAAHTFPSQWAAATQSRSEAQSEAQASVFPQRKGAQETTCCWQVCCASQRSPVLTPSMQLEGPQGVLMG